VRITPHNVHSFTIDLHRWPTSSIVVNDKQLEVDKADGKVVIVKDALVAWKAFGITANRPPMPSVFGRAQSILMSPGPLTIIVPEKTSTRELSIALRIAHDLGVYHRLDAAIVQGSEIRSSWESGVLQPGNLIVIGRPNSSFAAWLIAQNKTPFTSDEDGLSLNGYRLKNPDLGVVFLHPHIHPDSSVLFVLGTDDHGLERAARLFPIRTGVATPDWLVIGGAADCVGAAGVLGAGVWGRNFSWNSAMSWIY